MTNETQVKPSHEHKVARKFIRLIEQFRVMDSEMQAQQMVVFLAVVGSPGITMRKLEAIVGISGASISRNVAAMSKIHRKGKPGLDLLEAHEDPEDRRYKVVYPTPKGRLLFKQLLSIEIGG